MISPLLCTLFPCGVQKVSGSPGNHSRNLPLGRRTPKSSRSLAQSPYIWKSALPASYSFTVDMPHVCWALFRSGGEQSPALMTLSGEDGPYTKSKQVGDIIPVDYPAVLLLGIPKRNENICPYVHTHTCM